MTPGFQGRKGSVPTLRRYNETYVWKVSWKINISTEHKDMNKKDEI